MANCKKCGAEIGMSDKICVSCGTAVRRSKIGIVLASLFLLLVLAAGGYYYLTAILCPYPVKYSIGDVDSRFNVSRDDILKSANEVELVWNSVAGKQLFKYDSNAVMKINLVYDERQANLDKLNSEIATLDSTNQSISNINDRLDKMVADYQTDLDAYNAKLGKYNSEVQSWNDQGGAPLAEFGRLENTSVSLNKTRADLEDRRKNINKMAEIINIQSSDYNSDVNKLKDYLDQNKGKIITSGLYFTKEKKIDIFTFGDIKELKLLLMHEMGHSLGIGHDKQEKSIMYPILSAQDINDPKPLTEDIGLLSKTCLKCFLIK